MTYRTFPHAKGATVFSWMTGIASGIAGIAAIVLGILLIFSKFISDKLEFRIFGIEYKLNTQWVRIEIWLIVLAVILMLASKYIGRKLAQLTIRRKIKRSVKFAYNYCSEDPSYYKYAASVNPDFARKYGLELNTLTIVERSKYRRRQGGQHGKN